jgi:hypothetical protein
VHHATSSNVRIGVSRQIVGLLVCLLIHAILCRSPTGQRVLDAILQLVHTCTVQSTQLLQLHRRYPDSDMVSSSSASITTNNNSNATIDALYLLGPVYDLLGTALACRRKFSQNDDAFAITSK